MQATITYLLTEQAQRAQMAATGQPVARKQLATIEVHADDLGIFQVSDDGSITTVDLTGFSAGTSRFGGRLKAAGWPTWNGSNGIAASVIDPPFVADYHRGEGLLKAIADKECAEKAANTAHNLARIEAAYQRFLADPSARIGSLREYVGDLESPSAYWPENHEPFVAEFKRRNNADAMEAKAIAAAKEALKTAAIDAFVRASCPPVMIEQYDDGLLCRKTMLSLMATAALDACGLPAACPDSVVCDGRECPCGDYVVDCIPPAIYRAWKAFTLPEGSTVEFRRVRDCNGTEEAWQDNDDRATPTYYVAIVTIPSGPFQFTRRIRLEAK